MKILHIVPGTDDVANGMVVVARLLAKEQGDAEVVDLNHKIHENDAEEIWVHGMWLPKEWYVCRAVLRAGKRLIRMTHGSLSPVYLKYQSPLKKQLVSPIERFFLRRADKVVATCEAEKSWIQSYLGRHCPPIEVTDIKHFFKLDGALVGKKVRPVFPPETAVRPLHLLYLGRRHPLKGLEYLESAVAKLNARWENRSDLFSHQRTIELKVVSNAFDEEKEQIWSWCDVLVLPTLSENFGLVIAEALERGKRVITTDGAPAWGENLSRVEHAEHLEGGEMLSGYGGRLIYLKGYLDGSDEQRVGLLKKAIKRICG